MNTFCFVYLCLPNVHHLVGQVHLIKKGNNKFHLHILLAYSNIKHHFHIVEQTIIHKTQPLLSIIQGTSIYCLPNLLNNIF